MKDKGVFRQKEITMLSRFFWFQLIETQLKELKEEMKVSANLVSVWPASTGPKMEIHSFLHSLSLSLSPSSPCTSWLGSVSESLSTYSSEEGLPILFHPFTKTRDTIIILSFQHPGHSPGWGHISSLEPIA